MQKELNKKLKLDSINWVEVINGLEGKTTFTDHDIKRALRSTGRSFNNNGPFYTVVREFINSLGRTVTTKVSGGNKIYTITSTEDAIMAVNKKKPSAINKTKEVTIIPMETILSETPKPKEEEPKDHEKIKGLFKKSYTALEHAICLLAVYIKHAETELSGRIIKTEISDLGINWSTFLTTSKPVISEIYKLLGFNTLEIKKAGRNHDSLWKLNGPLDILDEYTRLCDAYEALTGQKSKNLDDYITTNTSKVEVERKYEIMKEIMEEQKKLPHEIRTEKDQEIVWKKWLLILASKVALGASRSLDSLLSWIKTERHYEIDEKEAEKLYRELMEDSENGLSYYHSKHVIMKESAWIRLSKFYSPSQFKEEILVKLPISMEVVSDSFRELTFKLDDTTTSGMYLYSVSLDRSLSCEVGLKKLLRFIQISGSKVYANNSWMLERVKNIIKEEDSNEKIKNSILLKLEERL